MTAHERHMIGTCLAHGGASFVFNTYFLVYNLTPPRGDTFTTLHPERPSGLQPSTVRDSCTYVFILLWFFNLARQRLCGRLGSDLACVAGRLVPSAFHLRALEYSLAVAVIKRWRRAVCCIRWDKRSWPAYPKILYIYVYIYIYIESAVMCQSCAGHVHVMCMSCAVMCP